MLTVAPLTVVVPTAVTVAGLDYTNNGHIACAAVS